MVGSGRRRGAITEMAPKSEVLGWVLGGYERFSAILQLGRPTFGGCLDTGSSCKSGTPESRISTRYRKEMVMEIG